MTAETKAKLLASENCQVVRESYYRATDGLMPLAEALEAAGLHEMRESVLKALSALDETEIGRVL